MRLKQFLFTTVVAAFLVPALGLSQSTPKNSATASSQVYKRLVEVLRSKVHQHLAEELPKRNLPPDFTIDDLDRRAKLVAEEAEYTLKPILTLAEADAQTMLEVGPDDSANLAALQKNWTELHRLGIPLPILITYLYQQIERGTLKGGWELELARRVSDFHLREGKAKLGKVQPRE